MHQPETPARHVLYNDAVANDSQTMRGVPSVSPSMTLQINGHARDFPDRLTVAALVAELGMKTDRVAVELNLEIVPRASWESTVLKDGDRLEIVHFVGGGADEQQ